jgi:hypothetical protein
MTPKDIFLSLTVLMTVIPISSFWTAVFAEKVLPHTDFANLVTAFYKWSIWGLLGYLILIVPLMVGWGILQVISSARIFYVDGERGAIHRRFFRENDGYVSLDVENVPIPEPRRSNLPWLDDEIAEILEKGKAQNDLPDTNPH